jgi:chromosome partitioning protein
VSITTLVFHLAHMLAGKGVSVLAVDLDPQSNLTAMFLAEERLEELCLKAVSTPTPCLAVFARLCVESVT